MSTSRTPAPRTRKPAANKRAARRSVVQQRAGALLWRLGIALFVVAVVTQYVRIITRNIVVSHEVASAESEIRSLQDQRIEEQLRIRRLERPDGAMPEIHDRLHLTRPDEAIVYLHHEGDGSAQQMPSDP